MIVFLNIRRSRILFDIIKEKLTIMKHNSSQKNKRKPQEISVSIHLPLKFNPTKIHLSFKGQNHPTLNNPLPQLQSQRSKIHEPVSKPRAFIQSANVSQKKLELEQRDCGNNLQFNKELKNRLKILHKRTKSNHIELQVQKEDQLSNFSISLQNISQEQIQIPFAKKKIITGSNRVENGYLKLNNFVNSCRNTIQKRVSPILKIPMQRVSREKMLNKQNSEKYKFRQKQKSTSLSKTKECIPSLSLSDFNLKAVKITEGSSIVYLAMHKKTGSIYAIKSIKKKIASTNIESFILQTKLSMLINNPNIAKIYGFYVDSDNVYIIKEYLQEGCIVNTKKTITQIEIGCQINHIINGVMSILPYIQCNFWSINLKNIALSQGICKIASIKVDFKANCQIFSDKLKKTLLSLLQSDRKSKNMQEFFQTKQSINLNIVKNGSYFTNAFRQILESFVMLSENEILMLWNTQFLKNYRYKSLMQQQK